MLKYEEGWFTSNGKGYKTFEEAETQEVYSILCELLKVEHDYHAERVYWKVAKNWKEIKKKLLTSL